MPIRPATWSDLLPASKIMAAAFKDNDLFDKYMHPKLAQYPDDFYLYFLRSLRIGYVSGPNDKILVSYKTDAAGREQALTGVAHWLRMSSQPGSTAAAPPSLWTSLQLAAVRQYNALEALFYPDRAADSSRLDVLARTARFYAHHWTGTRGEVWMLSHLAVAPECERQGIGRELVEWGFAQARREGVGCTVISAAGMEGFYRKCGFDVDDGTVHDDGGEENVLRDIPGGAIHFWDNGIEPKGVKKYGEA